MQRFPTLFVIANITTLIGLGLWLIGEGPIFRQIGGGVLMLSVVLAAVEVKTLTGPYQFMSYLLAGGVVTLLLGLSTSGAITLPLVLAAGLATFLGIARLLFFPFLTHTRLLPLEGLLWPVPLALYLWANIAGEASWATWALPLPMLVLQLGLSGAQLVEGTVLLRKARKGYKVAIGEEAPDFTLPDQDGNPTRLADTYPHNPVLLLFVRGEWCPHCHMMLRTYQRGAHRLRQKNIMLLAVGPDPEGVNKDMASRLGLDFKMLSDPQHETASMYGIHLEHYPNPAMNDYEEDGVPLPASFLLDQQGVIRYISRPDRVGEFLDPNKIFPIVDQLAVEQR
jgi:peroxiredoxin